MPYPVTTSIEPQLAHRNRLTTAFRLILAIPHVFLVGGVGAGFAVHSGRSDMTSYGSETGLLGSIAFLLAIISWFTIVFTGEHYTPIRRYTRFYLRWRVRALAYLMLLSDLYPPFGDGPYPASLACEDPGTERDRVSVGFRLLLAIPHYIVLFFLGIGAFFVTIAAWFAILFTGTYPRGIFEYMVGVHRWANRVEAYAFTLATDHYPPFRLGP